MKGLVVTLIGAIAFAGLGLVIEHQNNQPNDPADLYDKYCAVYECDGE